MRQIKIEAKVVIIRKNYIIRQNLKKLDKRIESSERIEKEWWNSLCWRKNLCSKQQQNTRVSFTEKSQSSKCRTSQTVKDAQVNWEELLVARN